MGWNGDWDKRMRPLRRGWKHWVEGLLLLTAAWKEAEHYTIGKASGVFYLRSLSLWRMMQGKADFVSILDSYIQVNYLVFNGRFFN